MTDADLLSTDFEQCWTRASTHVAIREDRQALTFQDLMRWSQAISRALEPSVREPGQRIAVLLPNSAAFVTSFLGIARLGAVVAPLSIRYRSQELTYYLNDLEPVAVVAGAGSMELLETVVPSLKTAPAFIQVSRGDEPRVVRTGAGGGLPIRTHESAPLLQLYTSGSVGTPKRVVRTHAALRAEVEVLRKTFDVSDQDRFLGLASFAHINGLVRTMLTSMYAGATLYPVEEFRRREILELMTRERITFFGGVSQMFALLSQTPSRGDVDLSSLRLVFSSSAPLMPADARRFHERYGVIIRQLYGSTETGTISFNRHPTPESCFESVGTALDTVSVEVVDEQGHALPLGEEGEFVIASPFAATEYLGNLPATRESFRNGAYYSGDLGVKDASGYLTLTGRKKLMINRGGAKVNPYEVEAAIKEHPKVVDVAVHGVQGPHGDDIVCAAIVVSEPCTNEEILQHCRDRIADFKLPSRIEFREALPVAGSGKILRSKL